MEFKDNNFDIKIKKGNEIIFETKEELKDLFVESESETKEELKDLFVEPEGETKEELKNLFVESESETKEELKNLFVESESETKEELKNLFVEPEGETKEGLKFKYYTKKFLIEENIIDYLFKLENKVNELEKKIYDIEKNKKTTATTFKLKPFEGNVVSRSYRINENVAKKFSRFCSENENKVYELISNALDEFIEKYDK